MCFPDDLIGIKPQESVRVSAGQILKEKWRLLIIGLGSPRAGSGSLTGSWAETELPHPALRRPPGAEPGSGAVGWQAATGSSVVPQSGDLVAGHVVETKDVALAGHFILTKNELR